jgi:hypothetical protein
MAKKLTIAGFRRFLEKAPRARFTPRSIDRCPLAQHTGQRVGAVFLLAKTTPVWARRFVRAFDADGRDTISGKNTLEIFMRSAYRKG